jgi:cytochrome c5
MKAWLHFISVSTKLPTLGRTAGALCLLALAAAAPPRSGAAAEPKPPATAAAAGVTLHSVSVELPDPERAFPGAKADAVNNNCLACHSAGMVLNQPHLSRADWQAEVEKMRNTYKAPIADADVPAIVDYLAGLNGGN